MQFLRPAMIRTFSPKKRATQRPGKNVEPWEHIPIKILDKLTIVYLGANDKTGAERMLMMAFWWESSSTRSTFNMAQAAHSILIISSRFGFFFLPLVLRLGTRFSSHKINEPERKSIFCGTPSPSWRQVIIPLCVINIIDVQVTRFYLRNWLAIHYSNIWNEWSAWVENDLLKKWFSGEKNMRKP